MNVFDEIRERVLDKVHEAPCEGNWIYLEDVVNAINEVEHEYLEQQIYSRKAVRKEVAKVVRQVYEMIEQRG